MKMGHPIPPEGAYFSAAHLANARKAAAVAGKTILDQLESEFAGSSAEFTSRLGSTLGYPVLHMADLHALQAAFDILPFTECMRRTCFVFRGNNGQWGMVFGDPFATDFRTWASETLPFPIVFHLTHRRDIAAYLTRQEET